MAGPWEQVAGERGRDGSGVPMMGYLSGRLFVSLG